MDIEFTQTGEYLIAAGSEQQDGRESFSPVLYISVVGDRGWATRYPVAGRFARGDAASAAALHYGIQIVTHQVEDPQAPSPMIHRSRL